MNTVFSAAIYLILALGVEHGILPLWGDSWGLLPWSEVRLVVLGVILLSCQKGEIAGLAFALPAAVISGALPGPGFIGVTLISYSLVAFVAAASVRAFLFERFMVRLGVIYVLVLGESWLWSFLNQVFWSAAAPRVSLSMQLLVAFFAAAVYFPIQRALEDKSLAPRPLAKRKGLRGR